MYEYIMVKNNIIYKIALAFFISLFLANICKYDTFFHSAFFI